MRRSLLLVAFLLPLVATSSFAQDPVEVPLYFAVGIPDNILPTIDGERDDWAWVDPSFEITSTDMFILTGGVDDADDHFIDILLGWNEGQNRVYGMVHVVDDYLIVDKNPGCTFRDDNCEIHFDPDNQGGGPYSAPNDQDLQPAYQICLSMSEQFPGCRCTMERWATSSRMRSISGGRIRGDFVQNVNANVGNEYFYEFSLLFFDPLSISGGPDASTEWILTPESTIGMGISLDDADEGLNANGNDPMAEECCENGFWWQAYVSMGDQFANTGGIPDVFLTPTEDVDTAVEATSWGQVKGLIGEGL